MEAGGGDRIADGRGDLADLLCGAEHLARVGSAEREPRDEVGTLG